MSTLSTIRKGLIQNSTVISQRDYRGMESLNGLGDGKWFFGNTGYDVFFSYNGHQSVVRAFQKCPPLSAVVNKKSKAFNNGKTWILNKSGKAKGKEATGAIASQLRKLLMRPNYLQSWQQFEAQYYTFYNLFEWFMVLPIKPAGFPNYEATALWIIPPVMVDIEETERLFLQSNSSNGIKKIVLTYKNEVTQLNASDIFIIKGNTPSFNSMVFPESRVCLLEMPINNIIGAYESRNVLINYRGALGIISPDSKDAGGPLMLKEDDKEDLQGQFMRYGIKNNQWKFILSSASVKWSQMGVATRDLMLFEEIEDSTMRICDQFDFPYRLLGSEKTNSLGGTDTKEFNKILYQDSIIPDGESIYEQWDAFFELDKYNLILDKDFSHVGALQADEQLSALARKTRNEALQNEFYHNMITLNMWLEKNGEDPLQNDLGEKYYYELVATGIQFGKTGFNLSDLANNSSTQNGNGNNK